jgi:hypothetical protein
VQDGLQTYMQMYAEPDEAFASVGQE